MIMTGSFGRMLQGEVLIGILGRVLQREPTADGWMIRDLLGGFAHVIMEAEKSHERLSASWRP